MSNPRARWLVRQRLPSRSRVTDPAHGVPFPGSAPMLLADFPHLPPLSRKLAGTPKLRQ